MPQTCGSIRAGTIPRCHFLPSGRPTGAQHPPETADGLSEWTSFHARNRSRSEGGMSGVGAPFYSWAATARSRWLKAAWKTGATWASMLPAVDSVPGVAGECGRQPGLKPSEWRLSAHTVRANGNSSRPRRDGAGEGDRVEKTRNHRRERCVLWCGVGCHSMSTGVH